MDYQPKDAKINLSIIKESISLEIDGASQDLAFLLISAIENNPSFLYILKMAIDFEDYANNKVFNN